MVFVTWVIIELVFNDYDFMASAISDTIPVHITADSEKKCSLPGNIK